MKASVVSLSLLVAIATAADLPVPSPEFAGYFSAGPDVGFILVDPTSNESSSWLKLGESWRGYRPISFDAPREILVVAKDAGTLQLKLRPSKVVHSGSLPKLLKGSFSVAGDTIVYSADAEISVSPIFTVRAFNGTMTYSSVDGTIRGELAIDHSAHPLLMIAKGGVMKLKDGTTTGSSMIVQKRPNKAPEPTP